MARRILDANEIFGGTEPKYVGDITDKELGNALNWYSQNKSPKDSQKYASDFFKKKFKLNVTPVLKGKASQFGFVCRVILNGATLTGERKSWFDSQVDALKDELSKIKTEEVIEDIKKGPNIQDRIKERADSCIGELEGQVDDFMASKFSQMPQPYGMMHTMSINGVHTRFIVDWAKKRRAEFDEVMNTDDKDLKEGYSNFSKVQLKKMVGYFDQVILDCGKVNASAAVGKKPRKKKEKTPEQLVAKLQYCPEFKDLSLTSVKSTDIIGALQLWVYNTKNRKLGVYNAEDAGGFSVKGSTITNFSESKSIQKTLRKPEVMLPDVLKGGKVFLRNVMDGIRAVESKLHGRLNKDIILLKVVK
jgi:hypothetical protein